MYNHTIWQQLIPTHDKDWSGGESFAHCAKVNQDLEQHADKHPPPNMFCRTLQNHPENNGAFNCWMMSRICTGTPNYNPCESPIENTWHTYHRKHALLRSFSSKAPKTIEICAFLCGLHNKCIVWTMCYWAGCHQIWTKSATCSMIQRMQQFYLFCYDIKELAPWGASDCALIFSHANSKRNSCSQQDKENHGWKQYPRLSWTTAAKSACKQGVWKKWPHFHLVEGSVEMHIVQIKTIWDAQSKNMARTIKKSWYKDRCS